MRGPSGPWSCTGATASPAASPGAATLAGLLALLGDDDLAPARAHLELGSESTVLLINTESDTDPENWARITAGAGEGKP